MHTARDCFLFKRITTLAQAQVDLVAGEGSIAVDATAGNGYDTLYLAEKVGNSGHVYSFDIQEEALQNTRERLKTKGLSERVSLIPDSHANISEYVTEEVSVMMYNLGYLPGGNQEVTTTARVTLESVEKSLTLLVPGGIITIVVYPGHPEGKREKELLMAYCSELIPAKAAILYTRLLNQEGLPPELIIIQRAC